MIYCINLVLSNIYKAKYVILNNGIPCKLLTIEIFILQAEFEMEQDILVVDILEDYRNLSVKHIFGKYFLLFWTWYKSLKKI